MSYPRILEITLYAITNFIPYLFLSLFTFRKHLRFSKTITGLISFLAVFVQITTRFQAALTDGGSTVTVALVRLFSYLVLFTIAVDLHFGKIFFVQIIFSNIVNFISILSICAEGILLSHMEHRLYCWHLSIIIAVLHLLFTTPLSLTLVRQLNIVVDRPASGKKWLYFWLIPATFYVIWIYQLYGTGDNLQTVVRDPNNVIFLFIINLGAFLIYHLVIWLDNELYSKLDSERLRRIRDVEQLEYLALRERMEETRRVRHDMRHHILIMNDYLQNQEYDKLKEYLASYEKSIPDAPAFFFCQNRAINRLILFFGHRAKEHNIDFQIKLSLPEDLNIPESDITILLGNLLENALDACIEQSNGSRKIMISGKGDQNSLFFTIDNTFDNPIKQSASAQFLSTKKHGSGIGLESVKHIVARYHGFFRAEPKDNVFYVSFMLNL